MSDETTKPDAGEVAAGAQPAGWVDARHHGFDDSALEAAMYAADEDEHGILHVAPVFLGRTRYGARLDYDDESRFAVFERPEEAEAALKAHAARQEAAHSAGADFIAPPEADEIEVAP